MRLESSPLRAKMGTTQREQHWSAKPHRADLTEACRDFADGPATDLDHEKLAPAPQTGSRASGQLIEECSALDEIARVETFGEAAEHRRQ